MAGEKTSAGDAIPSKCKVIEVHVGELKQLFNAIDPSPFRDKDLDPRAEEFIVGWSKDLPADAQLALMVYLDRPAGFPDEHSLLKDAIHEFFTQRTHASRQRLRQLFRIGRTSLFIGLVFLTVSVAVGNFVAHQLRDSSLAEIVRESLLIGGWVAMWRPLEVFLYDWWPIRNEVRKTSTVWPRCPFGSNTNPMPHPRPGAGTAGGVTEDDRRSGQTQVGIRW